MPVQIYRRKHDPDKIGPHQGRTDAAIEQIRLCMSELAKAVEYLASHDATSTTVDTDYITGLSTRPCVQWRANGPYRVDTSVDGAWIVPTACEVKQVWLHRLTAGTSSSTILDLNRNGSTMYLTQANRPTIAFDDADLKVSVALPEIVSLALGDIVTVDTDQVEAGAPQSWTLTIEVE